MIEKYTIVSSPCLDICALDNQDICVGCYRHGNEISNWGDYTKSQKELIIQRCQQRSFGNVIPYSKPQA